MTGILRLSILLDELIEFKEERKKTAVIIKGNPKYIDGNPRADEFYKKLDKILKSKGYETSSDPGEPYTLPKDADLWVGHSRGADRLRFAPDGTKTIAIGATGGINHPKDKDGEDGPNKYHYKMSHKMKRQIRESS